MLGPRSLRLVVATAAIRGDANFHATLMYWHWQAPDPTDDWARTLRPQTEPLAVARGPDWRVVEVGDCDADVTADGVAVHVYGHLRGRLAVTGHAEVVVAGDVAAGGAIYADGIASVFVGGDVLGAVESRGSLRAWVRGDFRGRLRTGTPSTRLHVSGDCDADIAPAGEASMLSLEVGGFMPYALLERAGAADYTTFEAVVGRSDRPAGFYPPRRRGCLDRWAVLAEGEARPADPSSAAATPTRHQRGPSEG